MVAIPVKTEKGDVVASLFGKAKYFSVISPKGETTIHPCMVQGGMNVVPWLKSLGVKKVVLNHVGEKPFHALLGADIEVFYAGEGRILLQDALKQLNDGKLEKVTLVN